MLKKTKTPEIVMVPIGELFLAKEAPKGADLTVRDSSSGSPLTDAELKASIYANGIIQPLIWKTFQDKRYVVAGNRRLRFLREIFHDAVTTPVQTQNVDDFGRDWREIAMDTNLSLPPHLVERYEVIVALTKDLKLSPEDARLRWGMTQRQFDQVMALGKMSPTVRAAWKGGEIDAKTAQAFTLEPDEKEQDRIFASVKKNAWRGQINAHEVRSKIVPANQRDTGRLVAFIGIEAAKKAKIIKREDLFSTDHVVTDVKALNKLAGDKLAEKIAWLTADAGDAGWAWALTEDKLEGSAWHYGTIEPAKKSAPTDVEKKRIDEISFILDRDEDGDEDNESLEDEKTSIEEFIKARGFTPEQRKKSGCIIKIGNDGTLVIEYGKVKPSERKSVAATERKKKAKAKNPEDGPVLTNALAERLSEQLQKAGAEALKAEHAVATSAIIAAISCGGHLLDIKVGSGHEGRKPLSFGAVFSGALESTPEQREAMLAQIAAQALSIIVFNGAGKMPLDDEGLVDLFEAMNGTRVTKAIAEAFDAKDYFASISMPAIVEAVQCAMGADHAARIAKMKKPEAAKFAAANLPSKGYLPKQLRTEHYTGPVESMTEKELTKLAKKAPKKATPAKRAAKKTSKKKK